MNWLCFYYSIYSKYSRLRFFQKFKKSNICFFLFLIAIVIYYIHLKSLDSNCLQNGREWIEMKNDIFFRKSSAKYFLEDKKLQILFIRKQDSMTNITELLFNFTVKYKNHLITKLQDRSEQETNELIIFFNIRQYQDFILNARLDLQQLLGISEEIDLDELQIHFSIQVLVAHLFWRTRIQSGPIKANVVGHFRRKQPTQETRAVVCTEPLFLERKDFASLAWWIELVKMSGYKKVVLYNNSIPNDRTFNDLFRQNEHFIEIRQLKCLPNFIDPKKDKYLSHYKEFIGGEWHIDNVHFLGFDAIANNECLYSHSNTADLVLVQDNDEAFLAPRLDKFNTLSKTFAFLSQKENSFSANKQAFPTRGDCTTNDADYLSTFLRKEVYSRKGVDRDHSFFFQNTIYANSELVEIIFDQISAIDILEKGFPIKLKIRQEYKPVDKMYSSANYGADFVLVINNAHELNYARNMLDVYTNLIKPFLAKNKEAISRVPQDYKRFYFFTQPLVLPQYGKSLTNLESSTFSDPHRPNGKVFELEEHFMSHFRSIAILERKQVSIKSFNVDFNYFFCYFQSLIERFGR